LEHNVDTVDAGAGRLGYHSLINAVILASIDDLGYDALSDEGTLDWINAPEDVHYNVETIRNAIEHMPLKKNGMPDARPAMRRVMETLDARNIGTDVAEVEVHFDQVDLDNIAEPTDGELGELEDELANMTWETE
tara:strand:+ start:2167 stop:2571 length:405 start_codon:yes stop_codon:yes gene_type:complete